jgi:hypothetical protein
MCLMCLRRGRRRQEGEPLQRYARSSVEFVTTARGNADD